MKTFQRYQTFRIPARIRNGGFPHEKIYRIKVASGETFEHIGFSSYMWDSSKKILQDKDLDGEIDGYVMVYFWDMKDQNTALVDPPQAHGWDRSGLVEIAKNDLADFPPEDIK